MNVVPNVSMITMATKQKSITSNLYYKFTHFKSVYTGRTIITKTKI